MCMLEWATRMRDGLSDYVDGRTLGRHGEGTAEGEQHNSSIQWNCRRERCKEMQERFSSACLSFGMLVAEDRRLELGCATQHLHTHSSPDRSNSRHLIPSLCSIQKYIRKVFCQFHLKRTSYLSLPQHAPRRSPFALRPLAPPHLPPSSHPTPPSVAPSHASLHPIRRDPQRLRPLVCVALHRPSGRLSLHMRAW
ncbi:unnamed protein product [Chondrus crispus]|uniref:Uncharacterized protein n=1 Tax=Chondrus crispus TaxID=2769 RepID=R7QKT9_CHOCR|nr:unnamed protein product [Chondrus crispus]CDF38699.1 unnamed protein product [Chondrus crispus]|eukprot:XP_005718604.1 unnamed protein product [Chondrus crispus]